MRMTKMKKMSRREEKIKREERIKTTKQWIRRTKGTFLFS